MKSNNLENNLNEREMLSADEQKICDLIGRLDQVDCPKNFDFRLKARIASADRKDFQPSVWQTLRYILPAAACVLIAAFLMIQAGMFAPPNNQPQIDFAAVNPNIQPFDSTSENSKSPNAANLTTGEIPADQTRVIAANTVSNTDVVLKSPVVKRTEALTQNSRDDEPMMSRDFGVRQNRKPLNPAGINPDQMPVPSVINPNVKTISAKDVFDIIGFETEFADGKFRVKSVREKSLAGFAGVKAGDLIESVDDVKIDQSEMMLKSNSVKKITFSRDGKLMEIRLQPN